VMILSFLISGGLGPEGRCAAGRGRKT
jgi:hypothetical protein